MREHDEAAIPVGRHADQVGGEAQHALIPRRRLGGVCNPEPQSQDQCSRNPDRSIAIIYPRRQRSFIRDDIRLCLVCKFPPAR